MFHCVLNIKSTSIFLTVSFLMLGLSGCAVFTVVDTAVSVTATAVKTTAKVAGAAAGATVDGVSSATKWAAGSKNDDEEKEHDEKSEDRDR